MYVLLFYLHFVFIMLLFEMFYICIYHVACFKSLKSGSFYKERCYGVGLPGCSVVCWSSWNKVYIRDYCK